MKIIIIIAAVMAASVLAAVIWWRRRFTGESGEDGTDSRRDLIKVPPAPDDRMQALADLLVANGIDASSLGLLFETASERALAIRVPGRKAIAVWEKLRGLAAESGHWPVILGDGSGYEDMDDILSSYEGRTAASIIEDALNFDFGEWMDRELQEAMEYAEDGDVFPSGAWPRLAGKQDRFTVHIRALTALPMREVVMALVPTKTCWEVPAYLRTGGWNACPEPEVHCGLMKYWFETYGAEVVGITRDVIEMKVERPPSDRAGALELAKEQYFYCGDIVDQGTGSIEALAATLLGGSVWFFWWD